MQVTVMFDITAATNKVAKLGNVRGIEAGARGYYFEGTPYTVDRAAVRDMLPAKWRKAYDRQNATFWQVEGGEFYCRLSSARGNKHIATIWAKPYLFAC